MEEKKSEDMGVEKEEEDNVIYVKTEKDDENEVVFFRTEEFIVLE